MNELVEFVFDNNFLKTLKDCELPSPDEVTYWEGRKSRIFYIDYEIGDDYSLIELSKIILQLNMDDIDKPEEELKPIIIFIHSYGGDLDQANYLADLIIASRIPIYTVAMGSAMSAGFIIFLAGHKRFMFNHSQLLVHEGSAAFQGTASEIEQAQKNYRKQLDEMKTYVLDRTSIDEKTFTKNRSKDWYLTKDEVIKYNIATPITNIMEIFKG